MNGIKKKSIAIGVLLILSIVVGILSVDAVIDEPNNLPAISKNATPILIRALMQFILAVIYASIPIVLYSLLKRFNKSLTIGFLAFRMIAVVFLFIGWLSILLIVDLGQEFEKAGSPEFSPFQTIDNLLRSARDLINHVAMPLIISVGNFMFYYILYQSKLIPRWLSVWGLVATLLSSVVASFLLMFEVINIITPAYIALAFPTALLEIVLAIGLITKGFDANVIREELN
ncbi:MAG: DUF4386 domain-containing protein [Flavobacteriales bacterium]|nr:DUF4386 domain-containing protein [Flavobacteriales bacterium]